MSRFWGVLHAKDGVQPAEPAATHHAENGEAGLADRMPGMLRSRLVVLLALIVAPWVTPLVFVETTVRVVAAVLVCVHLAATWIVTHTRSSRWARRAAVSAVAGDALGTGIILGAPATLYGAGIPLAAVVLVLAFQTGHWKLILPTATIVVGAATVTLWRGLGTPLILTPAFLFATLLNVDSSFAGAPAVFTAPPALSSILTMDVAYGDERVEIAELVFPTSLQIDASFDGLPAMLTEDAVFLPALGLAIVAICVGSAASVVGPGANPSRQGRLEAAT